MPSPWHAGSAPLDRLTVCTQNISWESNNARLESDGKWHVHGPPARSSSSFDAARAAHNAAGNTAKSNVGPAYVETLAAVTRHKPEVLLLQEYQVYDQSVSIIADAGYTVVAKTESDNAHRPHSPRIASIVAVRSDRLDHAVAVEFHDTTKYGAFAPSGRCLAAAVVQFAEPRAATYLIVSSHSAHTLRDDANTRQPWDSAQVQAYLDMFQAQLPTAPSSLVWGGDFNAAINADHTHWKGPHSLEMLPASAVGVTTRDGHKIDHILATSFSGKPPTDLVNEPGTSDHNLVQVRLRSAFADLAI